MAKPKLRSHSPSPSRVNTSMLRQELRLPPSKVANSHQLNWPQEWMPQGSINVCPGSFHTRPLGPSYPQRFFMFKHSHQTCHRGTCRQRRDLYLNWERNATATVFTCKYHQSNWNETRLAFCYYKSENRPRAQKRPDVQGQWRRICNFVMLMTTETSVSLAKLCWRKTREERVREKRKLQHRII